jgi:hypothetical protein
VEIPMKKRAKPMAPRRTNASNEHVIRVATAIVTLPLTMVRCGYQAVRGLIRMMSSEKHLRAADQLRQTRVRRELRGLPADHDPAAARPPA